MTATVKVENGRVYPMPGSEELESFVTGVFKSLTDGGIFSNLPAFPELMRMATKYTTGQRIYAVSFGKVQGFLMLTLYMCGQKAKGKLSETRNGLFAYCFNFEYPDCSELGYVFLTKKGDNYYRIG